MLFTNISFTIPMANENNLLFYITVFGKKNERIT